MFFPLGLVASVVGVSIWPLYYGGFWPYPPQLQHPRLMIFGFGFAFLIGFLGTAWPRFLEAKALRSWELACLLVGWLIAQGFYLVNQLQRGDLAFGLTGMLLIAFLLTRLNPGRSMPPPGFSLAFLTVLSGAIIGVSWFWAPQLNPFYLQFSKLVAYQGLLLLPILGVGSYLFVRFFSIGAPQASVSKARRAAGVWIPALVVMVSCALEASGWVRLGNLLRGGAMGLWMVLAVPSIWEGRAPSSRAWALRLGLGTILASFVARGIWPGPGYALHHLLFLGGFGLVLLLVADRVILGHSDLLNLVPTRSHLWRWAAGLILMAAATRVAADMKAKLMISHHSYAALLWVSVVVLWWIAHWRFQRQQSMATEPPS